ncbi:thiamine ABC transporter substrate-binding protein [Nocardioides guangzhouensis]|uniref:Thiamine ABC transporter substrate-binding protein n=1 Tax=Nocardioides guangzhouensis TaxID=2497878 RepID=A0A4V1XZV3_9ACTN|nr:thiamine ABC transporter substrate-binding protein [Nocardioides guangzhouensis]RYP88049.1 thiamine ABC transporter substrate-binding protein [Nocardioides guangzhouensis]
MFRRATATTISTLAALALTSCTLATESSDEKAERTGSTSDRVVLVTHESFALPKKLEKQFEQDTGLTLDVRPSGDAGALTNKLVLTQDNPIGDVAFGVDNTFASRALDADVFAKYDARLPAGADAYALDEGSDRLAPVDQASVCVNVDTAWYQEHDQAPPKTLDDLADPAYKDQLVVPGAPTSSPGMAFLLATIAQYGEDGWQDYWSRLMANGAKLTSGWNDAYFVDFTGGAEKGTRPIVVSYDTSPAFTVDKKTGRSTTAALLDTCFRQVEYAGVLENAKNPEGAQKVVDFLLSDEVQAALPDSMYVFPVADGVVLPKDWERFAVTPDQPYAVDPAAIAEHRQDWLTEWTDVTSR